MAGILNNIITAKTFIFSGRHFIPKEVCFELISSSYPPVTFSGVTLFCRRTNQLVVSRYHHNRTDDILMNDQILVFCFFFSGGVHIYRVINGEQSNRLRSPLLC